jgi:hypothetical protein
LAADAEVADAFHGSPLDRDSGEEAVRAVVTDTVVAADGGTAAAGNAVGSVAGSVARIDEQGEGTCPREWAETGSGFEEMA